MTKQSKGHEEDGLASQDANSSTTEHKWFKSTWLNVLLRQGPLAAAASALPGAVNYFIILLLTYTAADEETGVFRIIISLFALANLYTVSESSKIYVRSIANTDKTAGASLFVNQAIFAIAILVLSALAKIIDTVFMGGETLPGELMIVALISAVYMPAQCYMAYFQSKRMFVTLALIEVLKYGSSVVAFLLIFLSTHDTENAIYAQLSVMALWNVILFLKVAPRFIDFTIIFRQVIPLVQRKPASEARVLSLSVWLPGTLDHLDKFIIGFTQGLAVLGVYTLGYSTGRFLYNAMKPATYIFWRGFVDEMPTVRILVFIWAGFTALGAIIATLFYVLVEFVPVMGVFQEGRLVAIILFLSWGTALTSTVYTQSYSINTTRSSNDLLFANIASGLIAFPVIIAASFLDDAQSAMFFCVLYYPLRHMVVISILWRMEAPHRRA